MKSSEINFKGFTEDTFEFLYELNLNNNRNWFEANKNRFAENVKAPLLGLALDLNSVMTGIDPELETRPDRVISRIYRDTRFSRDKSPYKTAMWMTYKRTGGDLEDCPAYFFEITFSSYRYGMGFYSASRKTMDMFRVNLGKNPETVMGSFNRIIKKNVFSIEGEIYKRYIPNDLPEEIQAWYQRKNIYIVSNNEINSDLFSGRLALNLGKGYEILKPLYDFFLKSGNR